MYLVYVKLPCETVLLSFYPEALKFPYETVLMTYYVYLEDVYM